MHENRHQPDYVLYFTVAILCAVGLITVYSASTYDALNNGHAPSFFATRQLYYAVGGLLVMIACVRIPVRFWYHLAAPLMLVNIGLLVLVKLVGHKALGGQRWIGTGSIHLQPSEIAVVSTALYLAYFFSRKVTVLYDFKRGLRPALIVIALNFLLIFIEPDMGTALTLFATSLVILFASGAPLRRLFIIVGITSPILVGLAMTSYRFRRLLAFIHPFSASMQNTAAYQLIQGWTAISAGGWFGKGFGMSLAKTGYLPMSDSDFIFPVFVEEWGFIGGVALLITFGVLIWRGFYTARHAPDRFTALLAVGFTSMITIAAVINLGAVTGLLPVTGIPLPFISIGGTSLVMNMASMGVLLSISRYTLDYEPEADELAEVVDVEHARERQAPTGARELDELVSKRRQKPAEVRPLRPKRTAKSREGAWRARQEVAATKAGVARRSSGPSGLNDNSRVHHTNNPTKRKASSGRQLTWRERNEFGESSRQAGSTRKPDKRGSWRKER